MKNVLTSLLFALFTVCAYTQTVSSAKIEVLPVAANNTTVQLKVAFKSNTSQTYAVWHSTDLITWIRAELEYGDSPCIAVDTNLEPELVYTMSRSTEGRDFFKIAPFIPTDFIFTENLTIGSSGEEVACLQTFLSDRGFVSWLHDEPKGYFGDRTRWALISYQAAHSIEPASGFFGPLTRSVVNDDNRSTQKTTAK